MDVVLFGATGMVGQGVLRECLLDSEVRRVVTVVRSASGLNHPKLEEIVHSDFFNYSSVEDRLAGLDACFFTLGASSAGMTEEAYRKITYDVTITAAQTLVKMNPAMTFLYVSGAGTDSSESGGTMWARVKGKTENDLLAMPFKAAYMFRPGMIQPLHGIVSKTKAYRILYTITSPLLHVLRAFIPKYITTTEELGRAMIRVAKVGYRKPLIESREIGGIVSGS